MPPLKSFITSCSIFFDGFSCMPFPATHTFGHEHRLTFVLRHRYHLILTSFVLGLYMCITPYFCYPPLPFVFDALNAKSLYFAFIRFNASFFTTTHALNAWPSFHSNIVSPITLYKFLLVRRRTVHCSNACESSKIADLSRK